MTVKLSCTSLTDAFPFVFTLSNKYFRPVSSSLWALPIREGGDEFGTPGATPKFPLHGLQFVRKVFRINALDVEVYNVLNFT